MQTQIDERGEGGRERGESERESPRERLVSCVCKPPGPAFNPESMLLHLEVN